MTQVGDTAPVFVEGPLRVTDMVRYQGASGDMNPIHHDPEFALQAGYPSPFAVGMRQAGVFGALLGGWLGPENARRLKVRFRGQAWPGDVLTYEATVRAVRDDPAGSMLDVELRCVRQDGSVHLTGDASYLQPRPAP